MKKYCKLIFISQENSNKFYEMTLLDNGKIEVKYGRVDLTSTTIYKESYQWDKIVKEKIKKGYTDVTEFYENDKGELELTEIKDKVVNNFIKLMYNYTNNLVNKTYSSKKVTEKQLVKAQDIITDINKNISNYDNLTINSKLIELYTVIPRNMREVKGHLLPSININAVIEQEQDNLDALKANSSFSNEEIIDNKVNMLDILKVKIETVKGIPEEIKYLTDQIKHSNYTILKIRKASEDKTLKDFIKKSVNKTTRYLLHGTRCSSVIPIIQTGLQIRPSGNFQFSGKAFGTGNYYSEITTKSLNYTGYDNDKILFVYEVHVGNPYIYKGWRRPDKDVFPLTLEELSKRGYDSTYVEAGDGLLNSEIIVYTEKQQALRYIIHLHN